ncbi:hypothetical protein HY640_03435 [Candidatus Woesearchaeota archaeon]|nr:hypothetical protein [Candidatus Woesearchaeota archaeon]
MKFLSKSPEKKVDNNTVEPDEFELPPPPQIGGVGSELPTFTGPSIEASIPPLEPIDVSSIKFRKPLVDDSVYAAPYAPQQSPPVLASPQPEKVEMDVKPDFSFDFFKPQEHKLPEDAISQLQPMEAVPEKLLPSPGPDYRTVYISAPQYRQIVEDIDEVLANRLSDSGSAKLKESSDAAYEKWSDCLEEMQRRLMFIDKTLFEV